MKIHRKLLVSFLGIVLLFAIVGVVIILTTVQMGYLQAEAKKEAEIGNYASTYQMGIDLKKYAFAERTTDIAASQADTRAAMAIISSCETWLLNNIPRDSDLYAKFYACYQINNQTIDTTLIAMQQFVTEHPDQAAEIETLYTPTLKQAYSDITGNLSEFQAVVMNNIADANSKAINWINIGIVVAVVGIIVVGIISIIQALVVGKRISKPIVQLTDVATKVSMGDLNQEIKIKTNDEINDLAQAFQRMINAFKMQTAMSQEEETQ